MKSDLELNDPSSSSSSVNRCTLVVFLPCGSSCWIMCMSDVTECDTPLQDNNESKKTPPRYINTNSHAGYEMKYLSLQRHTSSCRDPCPVSQLALSSSLPTPSTSAPPFSSAAQDLYRSVAGMERWEGGVLENHKNRNTEKYWIQQEVEKHQITSKREI